ncbi:prepilin peptidase [Rubinisphaera margarita]|uniref:prepilin peptidase n=1 Tax=Rubinisphaera margarita TaxID=2909586 RepID=UPI001EE9A7DD|nr:prepilin peptidase [Rubinisphaera margarita]MCG6157059.1 prepilin peptidase [Rubinisphaera margarita]
MDALTILATVIFVLFAFGYGACFGSFLNVVVWRLPRRMPILLARSHCPKCKHAIPGSDNIPIFGWIRLKGRCRFCQLPISIRYPLVETAVALLFAALFVLIVVAHGISLPSQFLRDHGGNWLTEFPGCPLLLVYIHQIVLGYFLFGIVLIEEDGQQTPWRWPLIAIVLHFVIIAFNPAVGMMDYVSALKVDQSDTAGVSVSFQQAAMFGFGGALLAAVPGLLGRWLLGPLRYRNGYQAFLLIGFFLGPAFLLWTAMIVGFSLLAQRVGAQIRKNSSVSGVSTQVLLAWLIILCTWRWWPALNV